MSVKNTKHFNVFTSPPLELDETKNDLMALGNSASVVLSDTLPPQTECLKKSKHLPETTWVFIAPHQQKSADRGHFDIAWYQAGQSIQRCGHGTLAAARYLHNTMESTLPLVFHSASERLHVTAKNQQYCLQFEPIQLIDDQLGFFAKAQRVAKTQSLDGYYLIDVASELAVKNFSLKQEVINAIKQRALIVTAVADHTQYDIVFRYFAPQYGVLEDQATGSAGPCLWAFWQNQFPQATLNCYQASAKGGFFTLSQVAKTVMVSGYITEK